jgi:signal transduction histidine kinase
LSGLGLLVLTAFLGFNSIKQSEQRFIWVGMAKETAHQLGTPISSLLGWLEIMKSNHSDRTKIEPLIEDFESDIRRLEKVAARFSQIGSMASLKTQDIHVILKDTIAYFERRLPQSGKEIKIVESFGRIPPIPLNRDLFEWAIENLIKNAIDAVKHKPGIIEIKTGSLPDNGKTFIDIMDNGIGINGKRRRDVFKAGYSTKKRGWGLGLNFTKRIVEDYHGGKLYIKDSHPSRGTTMRIVI